MKIIKLNPELEQALKELIADYRDHDCQAYDIYQAIEKVIRSGLEEALDEEKEVMYIDINNISYSQFQDIAMAYRESQRFEPRLQKRCKCIQSCDCPGS